MSRRKGTPCACECNPCGSKKGIRAINNASPDPNGDFTIEAGAGIGIEEVQYGIRIANLTDPDSLVAGTNIVLTQVGTQMEIAVSEDINIGNLNVAGNIIQQGSAYETHAEQIYTTDDYIIMREGAIGGLTTGSYSGFQVTKYDGTNDGRLVIDNTGTARVGDVGDEQPLLTREESANMNNGALLKWDAGNSKAVDEGTVGSDRKPIKIVNGVATPVLYDLVDNTTSQTIGGSKAFTSELNRITTIPPTPPGAYTVGSGLIFYANDNTTRLSNIYIGKATDGKLTLNIELRNSDGTYSYHVLATST